MSTLIEAARAYARQKHAGQTRKGVLGEPYDSHLAEVAALTAQFGGDAETISAAWLHDTVEDCPPTSLADLQAVFGVRVAGLVGEVSDDKSLPKAERKRLQIAHAPHTSYAAALIKVADKTSNVRSLQDSPPAAWSGERRLAYVDWAEAVVAALAHRPAAAVAVFAATCAATRAVLRQG